MDYSIYMCKNIQPWLVLKYQLSKLLPVVYPFVEQILQVYRTILENWVDIQYR